MTEQNNKQPGGGYQIKSNNQRASPPTDETLAISMLPTENMTMGQVRKTLDWINNNREHLLARQAELQAIEDAKDWADRAADEIEGGGPLAIITKDVAEIIRRHHNENLIPQKESEE